MYNVKGLNHFSTKFLLDPAAVNHCRLQNGHISQIFNPQILLFQTEVILITCEKFELEIENSL